MEEKQLRRRYRFYGRVQGVGFRYVTQMAASGAGATGWVRNEYDGSVTMEIQGSEAVIDRVVQTLENARYIRIYGKECQAIALVPNERGFRVRY
jgi:acylphosphatase